MLQFFRINDPYRMIFVFLVLVVIRAAWLIWGLPFSIPELKWLLIGQRLGDGFVMYRDLYDYTGPLSALVYQGLDFVFGRSRWVHIIFSTFLITVQAGILNNILLKNKAYDENSYVPAFLYVIFMSGVMDFFGLSPQLMALTFLLLSLNHIFRRIDNIVTDELFIYSGLYLGIATCFYLPAGVFFFVFLLSLLLFSSAVLRRLLLMIYSTLVVVGIVWVIFFWFRAGLDFINDFFLVGLMKPVTYYVNFLELVQTGAFLLGIALVSFTVLFSLRVTNYQQKMQQMMLAFFLSGIVVSFLTRDLITADLLFVVPPLTFFSVYYLLGLKRRVWRALMPYAVVFGVLAYPVFILSTSVLDDIIVKPLDNKIPGERLMGIGTPVSYYQDHLMAGPFLDDYVSRKKLRDINYFDSASEIYEALEISTPDVIVDHWGEAERLFYRFPTFGERYEKIDDRMYQLKVSN